MIFTARRLLCKGRGALTCHVAQIGIIRITFKYFSSGPSEMEKIVILEYIIQREGPDSTKERLWFQKGGGKYGQQKRIFIQK